jgi:hypothetical protein
MKMTSKIQTSIVVLCIGMNLAIQILQHIFHDSFDIMISDFKFKI